MRQPDEDEEEEAHEARQATEEDDFDMAAYEELPDQHKDALKHTDPELFIQWARESMARMQMLIGEIMTSDKASTISITKDNMDNLIDKAIRPYFYYKDDVEGEGLTPKQFLTTLRYIDDHGPADFITWAKEQEDLDLAQGTPRETIARLTKRQASDFLDRVFGG